MKLWPGSAFNGRSNQLYEATDAVDFPPEDVGLALRNGWSQVAPPEPAPAPKPAPLSKPTLVPSPPKATP